MKRLKISKNVRFRFADSNEKSRVIIFQGRELIFFNGDFKFKF